MDIKILGGYLFYCDQIKYKYSNKLKESTKLKSKEKWNGELGENQES
jgi:hypothetical protein